MVDLASLKSDIDKLDIYKLMATTIELSKVSNVLINMDIVAIVLDLMHVHHFNGETVDGLKMLLFLELIIFLPYILI